MKAWITFIKERVPIGTYAFLAGGLALSGFVLSESRLDSALVIPLIGLLLFFIVLRLMDEYKDFEKDQVAHPNRPLPRGVLSVSRVQQGIYVGLGLMGVAALLSFTHSTLATVCYTVIGVYLWLMYKEFYVGEWLSNHPFLYAATHQVILMPICLYPVLVADPGGLFIQQGMKYGLLVLSSFFAYEICRKLDPEAHPILKTYLAHYGVFITSLFVLGLSLIGSIVAYNMNLGYILWPIQALLVTSLVLLKVAPEKFKLIELIATVSLIAHIWVIAAKGFLS